MERLFFAGARVGEYLVRWPSEWMPWGTLMLLVCGPFALSGCASEGCVDRAAPGVCVTVIDAWDEANSTCEAEVMFFDGSDAVPPTRPATESPDVAGACKQCGLTERTGDFVVRVEHADSTEEEAVSVELADNGCYPETVNLTFPSSAPLPQ